MDYTISKSNIHINDSYAVSKKDFDAVLNTIRAEIDEKKIECDVTENRKNFSLKLEWATHNFLYNLHFKRSSTKDVDLNYPQKWYISVAYFITGCISWIFIK